MSALRAIDVDDPAWEGLLFDRIRTASTVGGRGPVGTLRARAIAHHILELIREHAEDLEPVLAEILKNTADVELETQRSAARTARLEHALGLADVVPGALVGASTLVEYYDEPRPTGGG